MKKEKKINLLLILNDILLKAKDYHALFTHERSNLSQKFLRANDFTDLTSLKNSIGLLHVELLLLFILKGRTICELIEAKKMDFSQTNDSLIHDSIVFIKVLNEFFISTFQSMKEDFHLQNLFNYANDDSLDLLQIMELTNLDNESIKKKLIIASHEKCAV
jgi:hypothetical protein